MCVLTEFCMYMFSVCQTCQPANVEFNATSCPIGSTSSIIMLKAFYGLQI